MFGVVTMNKWGPLTAIFIGLTIILAILYDIIVLISFGPDPTISNVLNYWAYHPNTNPLLVCGFGVIIGGLIVHFFGWKAKNEDN